jgi:hypothetical protein
MSSPLYVIRYRAARIYQAEYEYDMVGFDSTPLSTLCTEAGVLEQGV